MGVRSTPLAYDIIHPRPSMDGWREFALCRGMDPDIWYPDRGTTTDETRQAKAVCEQCPVREACLEYALLAHEDRGIWGGQSAKERRAIARRRSRRAA